MNSHLGGTRALINQAAIVCAIIPFAVQRVRADFGVPITPTTPLNSTAASDTGNDSSPFLLFSDGAWLCVWHSNQAIGGIGADNDILMTCSTRSRGRCRCSRQGGTWRHGFSRFGPTHS